jgi:hypothetical protein
VKVAVALVLPAAFAVAISIWASSVVSDTPAEPKLPAGTVIWADRFFDSSSSLTDWLNSRGRSYRVWAKRHPNAAARQRDAEQERRSVSSPNG